MLSARITKQNKSIIALASLLALMVLVAVPMLVRGSATNKTWTTDADFDLGVLQGVEHTTVHDQLQLSKTSSTFPFLWIANAGEDTVSKIDSDTGKELARYRTWFNGPLHGAWSGAAPSRTAVDSSGNVYVANRHFDGRKALVMKVLSTGGIDRNGNGTIETSSDLDANGIIGAGEIKDLFDSNSSGMIDVGEIQDERVAWAVQVGVAGQLGRSLSIGKDGNIWLGTHYDQKYYKISAADGSLLGGPYSAGVTSYGSLVDGNGILWSANLGYYLGKLDTATGTMSGPYYHGAYGSNYGIALGNGKVYLGGNGYSYIIFDPTTNTFSENSAVNVYSLGVAVDGSGNIFVGGSGGGMYKFKPDGTLLWSAANQTGTGHIRGVVVDGKGDVWAIHLNENKISKFKGDTGAPLGVFPVGYQPYTYSDAAGLAAASITTPTGYWTVIQDGGGAGTQWGTVSWNGSTPAGTSLEVRVRAADTVAGLDFQTYQLVSSGVEFTATGQYIQIQVKFSASQAGTSPILYDLTVQSKETQPPPTPTPTATPPPAGIAGKMTGGGSVNANLPAGKGGKPEVGRTTHGLEVWAKADQSIGGNLQYNDHRNGDVFHATGFTSIVMSDDPAINPAKPTANFDTATVKGVGRLNGVDGVMFEAVITDAGEPGTNDTFKIVFPGGQSPGISGKLANGNHQAHRLP
ncbi:MAG: hypothetical protein HY673_26695 [Chloroflexi bacterium]|nr:hypothetical protein [Chloroflexota bacterium]